MIHILKRKILRDNLDFESNNLIAFNGGYCINISG